MKRFSWIAVALLVLHWTPLAPAFLADGALPGRTLSVDASGHVPPAVLAEAGRPVAGAPRQLQKGEAASAEPENAALLHPPPGVGRQTTVSGRRVCDRHAPSDACRYFDARAPPA